MLQFANDIIAGIIYAVMKNIMIYQRKHVNYENNVFECIYISRYFDALRKIFTESAFMKFVFLGMHVRRKGSHAGTCQISIETTPLIVVD